SKGETSNTIIYIVSGQVGIYIEHENLTKTKLATLGPGSFLGEMAYILSEPRTATAVTEEPTVILELPPEVFEQVLHTDTDTSRYIIDSLSKRIKSTNEQIFRSSL
ncbi:MAG: cyclic nucleotide-binding domain-containing protein, partial [Termitinemataceae bacterium]